MSFTLSNLGTMIVSHQHLSIKSLEGYLRLGVAWQSTPGHLMSVANQLDVSMEYIVLAIPPLYPSLFGYETS